MHIRSRSQDNSKSRNQKQKLKTKDSEIRSQDLSRTNFIIDPTNRKQEIENRFVTATRGFVSHLQQSSWYHQAITSICNIRVGTTARDDHSFSHCCIAAKPSKPEPPSLVRATRNFLALDTTLNLS